MLATGERTSIEIALENGSKFPVYAVVRLFSNIDMLGRYATCTKLTEQPQGFFGQFWEGALGPFRLGKLAR